MAIHNATGIVTFAYRGDPGELQQELDAAKVEVTNRREKKHVRASAGLNNNRAEVDQLLEVIHYDLPGHESPLPRIAPLSFVVRYYGPVADAADFIGFYTKNHPPLLAKFPGIRNMLCYLPLNWQSMNEITDDYMFLGNEVVFDNLDARNQALASDVMPEVQADSEHFAAYGYNTHHAMQRRRVYARGDQ